MLVLIIENEKHYSKRSEKHIETTNSNYIYHL